MNRPNSPLCADAAPVPADLTDAEAAETEALLAGCPLLPPTAAQMQRMLAAVAPRPRGYQRRTLAAAAVATLLVLPAGLLLIRQHRPAPQAPAAGMPLQTQTYILTDPADRTEIVIRVQERAVAVPDEFI